MKPEDALEYAQSIHRTAAGEAACRNAAGRLYYAVFWHFRDHPLFDGFDVTDKRDVHSRAIEWLKAHKDPTIQRLGRSRLARLRALRNHADYDPSRDFLGGLADEALELAVEIIGHLAAHRK